MDEQLAISSSDPASRYVTEPRPIPSAAYERDLFLRKLGPSLDWTRNLPGKSSTLSGRVHASIIFAQRSITSSRPSRSGSARDRREDAFAGALELRSCLCFRTNRFPNASSFLFPRARAMESKTRALFAFATADSRPIYYATYTAYDGRTILPQLLETQGFSPLQGLHAQWARRPEQGHGDVSQKSQWAITACSRGRTTRTST